MCAFIQGGFKGPWKAVEGGIQLSVDFSYQVPPNETYQECFVKQMSLGSHMAI